MALEKEKAMDFISNENFYKWHFLKIKLSQFFLQNVSIDNGYSIAPNVIITNILVVFH